MNEGGVFKPAKKGSLAYFTTGHIFIQYDGYNQNDFHCLLLAYNLFHRQCLHEKAGNMLSMFINFREKLTVRTWLASFIFHRY